MSNTTRIEHRVSSIDYQVSKTCKSCRYRARNKNKIMQNKPNYSSAQMFVSASITKEYENYRLFSRRKNKAKQTQNEPNFSSKLALFSQYWLCFSPKIAVKWQAKYIFLCEFYDQCGKKISMLIFYIKKLTVLIRVNLCLKKFYFLCVLCALCGKNIFINSVLSVSSVAKISLLTLWQKDKGVTYVEG